MRLGNGVLIPLASPYPSLSISPLKSRKYVMGTAGVFGEANNSAIAGVIIVRGKDWKPVLSVAPDMDSYNVTPVDIKTPEGKKTFDDFMLWEAEVDGKKWADGKILKVSLPTSYKPSRQAFLPPITGKIEEFHSN